MRANLGKIYDDTITVINKLDAKDSLLKQDAYYKTVIDHCMWTSQSVRDVSDSGVVNVGTVNQVQIPESEHYLPYKEWRKAENRDDAFTLRMGDYVIRGKVEEDIDASNIKKVVSLYEPEAFQIQSFIDATKKKGFNHSNAGIMRFIEVYYVEG